MRPVKDVRVMHAHAIDLYVGERVRMRRKALKISQIHLSEKLGLTFQQVQKYERGSNRISASKLYEIAQVLQVPVTFFFEGYGDDKPVGAGTNQDVHAFLHSMPGLDLGEAFLRLANDSQRNAVLVLMKSLAEAG